MIRDERLVNWFTHHPPTPHQVDVYETIRKEALHFAQVINEFVPDGPDKTMAIRKLREAVMTANAAIACEDHLLREEK